MIRQASSSLSKRPSKPFILQIATTQIGVSVISTNWKSSVYRFHPTYPYIEADTSATIFKRFGLFGGWPGSGSCSPRFL